MPKTGLESRTLAVSVAAAALVLAGCAPTLRFSRPSPPEASFGAVRALSVDVSTNVKRSVETSVIKGMARGEIPVPVPMHTVVRSSLVQTLEGLGYEICPAAPCGEGAMDVVLTESSVGTEWTRSGPVAHARITARIKVRQSDGVETYDYTFWARRSGSPGEAPALVKICADLIADRMLGTLSPGRERVERPLEDGGELTTGVNMLLSSNWGGAAAYVSDLVRRQPDLDGAWYDLGVAFESQGDWPQALAAYEQAAARERKRSYLDAVATARSRVPPAPLAPSAPPPAPPAFAPAPSEPPPPPPPPPAAPQP